MKQPVSRSKCIAPTLTCLALFPALISPLWGQAGGATTSSEASIRPRIDFDVVSIKASKDPDAPMRHAFPQNGDGMTFTNAPLAMLIFYLCNGDHAGVSKGLPGWTRNERYDIAVKVTGANVVVYQGLDQTERKQMLLRVLEDRFKLRVHHESRSAPVCQLTITRGGPKLKTAQPSDAPRSGPRVFYTGAGQLSGHGAPIGDLAAALSESELGRQVVDKTGLNGLYSFTLNFAPDAGSALQAGPTARAAEDVRPSIFTALREQLGLKLEPSTALVDTLVIDRIEKPSEN